MALVILSTQTNTELHSNRYLAVKSRSFGRGWKTRNAQTAAIAMASRIQSKNSTILSSTIWSTCTIWTLEVLSAGAFIVFSIGWRFFAFGRASKFVQIFDQKCRKVAIRTRDINSHLSLVYRRYSIRLQTGPVSYSAAYCEVYPRYRISCIPR